MHQLWLKTKLHPCNASGPDKKQLIDYGYIQDVEVDSDDEDSDDEQEADETQTAEEEEPPGGRGEEPPAQADPTTTDPPPDQPSADGEEGSPTQPDGASPEEGSGGPAGEIEEQVEPVSPSAGAPGLAAAAAAEAGEGRGSADGASQPPRFGPQRMFMDEVVERVCDCDLETEEVQLQVIKALVHACTATTLAVHQASLLTAVKTIYTASTAVLCSTAPAQTAVFRPSQI